MAVGRATRAEIRPMSGSAQLTSFTDPLRSRCWAFEPGKVAPDLEPTWAVRSPT
ncbi:MAG TPA: hypothetical protein VIL46_13850 [Gemmataceae bacterium]